MKRSSDFQKIFLCLQKVDFRKRRKTLAEFIAANIQLDVFSGALFLFINRKRDLIRGLYWQKNGFCVWEKELEEGRFPKFKSLGNGRFSISTKELDWLLDGVDFSTLKVLPELKYSCLL
jgi:hypothetical protein